MYKQLNLEWSQALPHQEAQVKKDQEDAAESMGGDYLLLDCALSLLPHPPDLPFSISFYLST